MKFGIKIKILLFVGVFIGLSALILFLVIYPFFKEIKKNSEDFVFEKNRLIQLNNEIERLRESEKLYHNHLEDIEKIDKLFVNAELPTEFMGFLEDNAAKSQVDITVSSAVSQKSESSPWPNISFQVSITGSFPNCLKFLEKLEIGPYVIEILNLNVSRPTETESRLSLESGIFSTTKVKMIILVKAFTK